MISRVADHCFWFGRYIERAESTARLLSATDKLAMDGELGAESCWPPVVVVSGEREHFDSLGKRDDDGDAVQRYMALDRSNMTSIRRSIGAARDNAQRIREVLSLEAWETVNGLHLWIQSDAADTELEQASDAFYRRIRQDTQLCLGLLRSTMLHDAPLNFIWLGVLLERVGQTARILDVHHHAFAGERVSVLPGKPPDAKPRSQSGTGLWLSLLHAVSGFEAYMRSARGRVSADDVARFLFLEPRFPRSISYGVHSARERIEAVRPPNEPNLPGRDTYARIVALDDWVHSLESPLAPSVHENLTHVVDEIALTCSDLGRELLGHGPSPSEAATALPPAQQEE